MPPIEEVLAENATLKAKLSGKDGRVAELEAQIAWFRRRSSPEASPRRWTPTSSTFCWASSSEPRRPRLRRRRYPTSARPSSPARRATSLYGNLPVLEETLVEPDEVKAEPSSYERIGEEETYEVKVDPPKFYRRRIVRPKYRKVGDKTRAPVLAPAPVRVVEGIASAELLAYIVVSKFTDHLPLYRQCSIYKRYGFAVSRQNLVRWVEKVAEWLKPIYSHMRLDLLEGGYVQVDDMPIKYRDPDYGEKKTKTGYLCGMTRPLGDVWYK